MRIVAGTIIMLLLLSSCARRNTVIINGRVENGDTIVSVWVDDTIYSFPLDENGFFSGSISLQKGVYASFLPNSLDIYLSPGEDLEIYVDMLNTIGSLNFRGSLGGINNYMKEQEMAVFFNKDYYYLDEQAFVKQMQQLIEEKTTLLEAKNFDAVFTNSEKLRIRYSVGERVLAYPLYRQQELNESYRPGKVFNDFLATFSLDNDELFVTRDYRKFLLNYVYFQGGSRYPSEGNYTSGIADYILTYFTKPDIRDFLLSEVVYRYMWENNGVEGAEHLLEVFRRECKDSQRIRYIEGIVSRWEKLLAGQPAPDFMLKDTNGNNVQLKDFRGTYLYISVWASWCAPCKKELPYIKLLEKEYEEKNIKFLCVSIDIPARRSDWEATLKKEEYGGIQAIADDKGEFNQDYMIISVPRFILIDPEGKIVSSNAPRPSGSILYFLNQQMIN